ncbi:MAG: AIM24 family protein [Methanocella sp.]
MPRYSLEEFVQQTAQKDKGEGMFELENHRLLEINLNGLVWIKIGAMVAYTGSMKFEREGMMEAGIDKLFKKALTGEGVHLSKATGTGKLYVADNGKRISIINLQNESIFVNGNDVLAFESSVKWDIKMMRRMTSMMAGGLFNVKLEGTGMVAITTYGEPVTLRVTKGQPVITDPNATVAWSGNLMPELRTDINLKTLIGRGSGESIQSVYTGEGFVVVQPYEEVYYQQQAGGH